MTKKIVFTPSLFFQYSTCDHWIWFDNYADISLKGELPELAQKLLEQGILHEEDYIKTLSIDADISSFRGKTAYKKTLEAMQQGTEYIYQGFIEYKKNNVIFRGRPDLLKRVAGKSKFGNYYYTPIDIKNSNDIKKDHWLQLSLYAEILQNIQNQYPSQVAIINTNKKLLYFNLTHIHKSKSQNRVNKIIKIIEGEKPPVKLVSTCKNSPWYQECIKQAEQTNDIALLYKVNSKALNELRANNINTISEAAHMNINELPKIPFLSKDGLKRAKLQAQSLLTNELRWLKKPKLSKPNIKIFFDIEGDPLLRIEYLFGFWIVGDNEKKLAKYGNIKDYPNENKYYLYFIAEKPEQEQEMWNTFIKWCKLLPKNNYKIYHFADYERVRSKTMAEKYGGLKQLNNVLGHLEDLSKIVQECVILPLYFYSIKDIAKSKFLNYKWRHPKAGGAQSIFWYEKWLETSDQQVLNDIINYNEDDVRATEYLYKWLLNQ